MTSLRIDRSPNPHGHDDLDTPVSLVQHEVERERIIGAFNIDALGISASPRLWSHRQRRSSSHPVDGCAMRFAAGVRVDERIKGSRIRSISGKLANDKSDSAAKFRPWSNPESNTGKRSPFNLSSSRRGRSADRSL